MGGHQTIAADLEAELADHAGRVALLPSPLCGPTTWRPVADLLGERAVVLPCADDGPPYWESAVAHAVDAIGGHDTVLVGHSGAGPLLAEIAARAPVRVRLVFVDAGLPFAGSRLDAMAAEDEEFADELRRRLVEGVPYPSWTSADLADLIPSGQLREAMVRELRPRGLDFFTESLPGAAPDWHADAAYLQLSAAYERPAERAAELGVPVRSLDGMHHFSMLSDPQIVTEHIVALGAG